MGRGTARRAPTLVTREKAYMERGRPARTKKHVWGEDARAPMPCASPVRLRWLKKLF
jgi:hypothetical protein